MQYEKVDIVLLQNALDERFEMCDKLSVNGDLLLFRNENSLFYKGMLATVECLGLDWKREDGKHKIFGYK